MTSDRKPYQILSCTYDGLSSSPNGSMSAKPSCLHAGWDTGPTTRIDTSPHLSPSLLLSNGKLTSDRDRLRASAYKLECYRGPDESHRLRRLCCGWFCRPNAAAASQAPDYIAAYRTKAAQRSQGRRVQFSFAGSALHTHVAC